MVNNYFIGELSDHFAFKENVVWCQQNRQ